MAEPKLEYRIWQYGAKWHWQVMEVMADVREFVASGVADSARAARIAALKHSLQYQDRQSE